MIPIWLQWFAVIVSPIGTFITALALFYTIRQWIEARRMAGETAKGLQTVVETMLKSLQPIVEALRNLQEEQVAVSPWVQAAITAVLASQSAVVEAAKPYVEHSRGLSAMLDRLGITDVSGGTSAQGPVFEALTGESPPVPPGTTFPIHLPKKDDP